MLKQHPDIRKELLDIDNVTGFHIPITPWKIKKFYHKLGYKNIGINPLSVKVIRKKELTFAKIICLPLRSSEEIIAYLRK